MTELTAPSQRWTLHEAHEADDADVLQLFAQVFGYEMTAEHWRWKYAQAPMRGLLLRRQGVAVAFYGGMPREVQGPGRVHHAVQNGDVMVHPGERGMFTRKGAFFSVSDAFLSRHIGPGRTFEFGFGFPNERAFGLPAKLGLYIAGGRMDALRWEPASAARASWLVREQPLDATSVESIGKLWDDMQRDWPALYIPVRDPARWRLRFLQRPGVRYQLLLVRRRLGGRPLAAAVLREHAGHVEWLDYVGGLPGIALALAAVRRYAAHHGGKPVTAICSSQLTAALAIEGASVAPSGIVVPLRAPEPGWPQPYPWQDKLWLMGGDSDFL
ncbi:MAG: GNAT family N-acetyltransferase [Burkholderiales bacterium]|nr:GNAT family N-acetyltransferase [Burkholderiales bacterium]